jgi:hypothetical protein
VAETYWPFDGIDNTETQWSQMMRNIGEGVKGSSATTDLKVTAPGTGMTVSLAAGQAMIRGLYYYNTTALTLAVTTANATLPRIDSVVLTLDPTANTITASVLAGTAAASPVAPTLTQTDAATYQFLLANIAVAAATATISSGNVTDSRTFLGGVTLTGSQTLTNKTLTSPVETNPTVTGGSFSGVALGTAQTFENAYLTATAFSTGGYSYYTTTNGAVQYITANSTGAGTLNITSASGVTLNSIMATNQSVTVVFALTQTTTGFLPSAYQIDGSAVTPKWAGGSAPTASASAIDVLTFTIIKTASATFTVLASATKFA